MPGLQFPSTPFDTDRDIRYWLNFQATEYESKQILRSFASGGGGGPDISLPMPKNMQANSDINYTSGDQDTGMIDPSLRGMLQAGLNWVPLYGTLRSATDNLMGRKDMDTRDSVFTDAGFRKFSYSWSLVPKNDKDAGIIADIVKTFQVHAYPSISSVAGATKVIHPMVWRIAALDAPGNDEAEAGIFKWDMGPLLCVLNAVKVQTVGLGGGVVARKDGSPTITGLSLDFTELEPAIRNKEGNLVSRSDAKNFG